MKKGALITIEGIDGCGKSTLAKNLAQQLQAEGRIVVLTKEPGQTTLGTHLATLLQHHKKMIGDRAEFLLFAANRAQHFEEIILPALAQGAVIISDRMADSSLAYQGYGRGLDHTMITTINQWAMHGKEPHCTFYLRIDAATAFQRVFARKETLTSFEQEKQAFWQRVIEGYEAIAASHKRVVTLDATCSPETLTQQALRHITSLSGIDIF